MVRMLLSSCPVWDSWSPASLFAGPPFTPWGASSRVASRFKQVTHSYGPGLYSRLRHPAYAGSLLAYFGLGLAFSNWWTLACSVLPYLVAIGYRIHVEEAVLQETFGPAYAQYARTTKRIVPWVY